MRAAPARQVHPGAWWLWALGLAVAVSTTTNPLLLAIALSVACLVVAARRGSSPWARAFRLYLLLGLTIVVLRLFLHVLVGLKFGTREVIALPSVQLPAWAAGIDVGGTVYLEGLLAAGVLGLRLAVLIACIGAANALANPKQMLKTLPKALNELGTAVVISITVAPQLAESVQRVMRARQLRGDTARGLRAVRQVALPVLQDTLDRSLLLASAMDSRGYGRRGTDSVRARRTTATLTLGGLLGAAVGIYGVLDTASPAVIGLPLLVGGLLLGVAGLWLGGRNLRRSSYRPDPWRGPEWITAASGLLAAACVQLSAHLDPLSMTLPVQPLAPPALPLVATMGLLLALAPAVLTPEPPQPPARQPQRPGATAARTR